MAPTKGVTCMSQKQLGCGVRVTWLHEAVLNVPPDMTPNDIWENIDLGHLDDEVKKGNIQCHDYVETSTYTMENEHGYSENVEPDSIIPL